MNKTIWLNGSKLVVRLDSRIARFVIWLNNVGACPHQIAMEHCRVGTDTSTFCQIYWSSL